MICAICCPALSSALKRLKKIVAENERTGKTTLIFCEDRLTLAAERTVCSAVGGTFSTSVYTFARFLSACRGKREDMLSAQGSAMAIRRLIEENRGKLKLFGRLSAASAAQAVYDTIALFIASGVTPEQVSAAAAQGMLVDKLHDLALLYSGYIEYLSACGKTDRNRLLKQLPSEISASEQIRSSEVIFLAYQSFTRSALDCVRAAFGAAKSVMGVFVGGESAFYVNEAHSAFVDAAEEYGGAVTQKAESDLVPEAELLRVSLFDPVIFHRAKPAPCKRVHIIEAADEEEELEFIAAYIKKHVLGDGLRYVQISVLLPDLQSAERRLARVFAQYRIPYYADKRIKLNEHPLCAFVLSWLGCVLSGCSLRDTEGVIASPLFPALREDKDKYRNYALRFAHYRGGIKREPNREKVESCGYDYDAVQRVRETFLKCLKQLPERGGPAAVCAGIKKLLVTAGVEDTLKGMAEKFRDTHPVQAQFSARAQEAFLAVLDEAESIAGDSAMPLAEFVKILKSGMAASEISLIPPKADAVFVSDCAATENLGSKIVFAARMTGDVPGAGDDTALLTDREITALEEAGVLITPKIRQVNARRREITALNVCAFENHLYLSYPVRLCGEECGRSEIISYASALFAAPSGGNLAPVSCKRLERYPGLIPYYCSEKQPALKRLNGGGALPESAVSAIYSVLSAHGYGDEAEAALNPVGVSNITVGKNLFAAYGSVSPTALENYFSCPYKSFMQNGLKLQEREEQTLRVVDVGNFIHAVLCEIAPAAKLFASREEACARAAETAEKLLTTPLYSPLTESGGGRYAASRLVSEAREICGGVYEQLCNSGFAVENTEKPFEIYLADGLKLYGKIDRVDACGDMVRVIDYKTGTIDSSAAKYYMGLKLQLPLYLLAASKGRRGVGAYYFPASYDYRESDADNGVFRMRGFTDVSKEVLRASDTTLTESGKSKYIYVNSGGKPLEGSLSAEDFGDFLGYARLIAQSGAEEMFAGNIQPSPVPDACKYCRMGGSCGFAAGEKILPRKESGVSCADIAAIVRGEGGKK